MYDDRAHKNVTEFLSSIHSFDLNRRIDWVYYYLDGNNNVLVYNIVTLPPDHGQPIHFIS